MELKLEEKLERMKKGKRELVDQVNAFSGAIQMLQELIVERDKPEPVKEASNG